MKKIEEAGVLQASDQGSVFTVAARGKTGSPRDVEKALGIKRGKGGGIVEFDASLAEFEVVNNPLTGAREFVFKGNVDLAGRNPVFRRNQ